MEPILEFPKQRQDKLPNLTPGKLGMEIEAGQIHEIDPNWLKATYTQGKKITKYNEPLPDTPIVEDEYIKEIAQSGKAQVFLSDVAAAAIMCSQKANYSWDVEIKKFREFVFIDKREKENILQCDTVSETAPNDQ